MNFNQLAPIVLFVYNRPIHTKQTISALSNNSLSKFSNLYIFFDGIKTDDEKESKIKHQEVKDIIYNIKGFNSVKIIEREINFGLAKNIILGVSQILNNYDKIIVLEDDLVVSDFFLEYMNGALDLYNNDEKVGCIHAWNYNLNISNFNQNTFFLPGADCWGWATWKRSWTLFNHNSNELIKIINEKNLKFIFNRRGRYDYYNMLLDNVNKKNNSWAIRWHASLIVNNKFCLYPTRSLVRNIGMDGTGTHCKDENIDQAQFLNNPFDLEKINVEDCDLYYIEYDNYIKKTIKNSKWTKLKIFIKKYFL